MKREKTVSLCMIVKDEEKYLERCLNSVKKIVDEMIIVDTGSTDRTVEIAKSFGASVSFYKWNNDFSKARNFSLKLAKHEWILLMDADDELNSEDEEKLIKLINTSTKDGHYFSTLSFTGEKPGNDMVVNLNLRLLRNNKKYKFAGAIHEQLVGANGKIDYTNFSIEDIRVFHYGYLSKVAAEKNKRERNIALIEKELAKDPDNKFHLFNLGNEYFALNNNAKALELFNKAYANLNFKLGFASKLVIRRVMCFVELGQDREALTAIAEGLVQYPNFTDLEFMRAVIHFKNKRYTLAIDSLMRCLELGAPGIHLEFLSGCGTYRPYLVLGELYLELDDYEKALFCFNTALKINPSLQEPIYKIGTILNKTTEDKKMVTLRLSQYFDLSSAHNLIVLADILLNEGLYDLAREQLEKAKNLEVYDDRIDILIAKTAFYQRRYTEAKEIFEGISEHSIYYEMSLRYLFILDLIIGAEHIHKTIDRLEKMGKGVTSRVYLQLYNTAKNKEEMVLEEKDDPERMLQTVIEILDELLKVKEFHLFEKLLNIMNVLNSNRVLLELGKLYYQHGFKAMAVKEILRSIKELNTFDGTGAKILCEGVGWQIYPYGYTHTDEKKEEI